MRIIKFIAAVWGSIILLNILTFIVVLAIK